jgi:hypothetical protein
MPRSRSDAIRRSLPVTLSSQQQFRQRASVVTPRREARIVLVWQLTLQKLERNRSAVQFNEGAFATGVQNVSRAGNQHLTGKRG